MVAKIDLSSDEAKDAHFACVDLMKFLCAILVVAIHVPPLTSISPLLNSVLVNYIAKLAVPFFFVASGYFLFRKTEYDNFNISVPLAYSKRILKLYLRWSAIYLVPSFYYTVLKNDNGTAYGLFSFVRNFFFVGYHHLWYLLATVIAVCSLTYLLKKRIKLKSIIILGMGLYMLGLFGQSWFGLIKPLRDIPLLWTVLKLIKEIICTTRNGIFEGILFMGIGMLFAWRKIELKFRYAVIGFAVSMLGLLSEVIFVKYFKLCRATDMYLFLVPAVFFLFYIVSHIKLRENKIYKRLRTTSFLIYLVHSWIDQPVMAAINKFMKVFYGTEIHSLIRFFAVSGLSIIVAALIMYLVEKRSWNWLRKLY